MFTLLVRRLHRHVQVPEPAPDPHELRDVELDRHTAEVLEDIDGALAA